ncbi:MAG: chemotaxis protein CheW [bacterium]
MLVLLLRAGDRRYALDARQVVEVVPWVPLRPAPGAPEWIAGLLAHRDGVAPVIDLSRLLTGIAAAPLLSTRLIVLRRDPGDDGGLIALLAEGATEMTRLDVDAVGADGRSDIQLVAWTDLLPAALHASLPERSYA